MERGWRRSAYSPLIGIGGEGWYSFVVLPPPFHFPIEIIHLDDGLLEDQITKRIRGNYPMKDCEKIEIEVTPTGAIFRGKHWPDEINVDRNLLDYLPGPHVTFGRYGVLRFTTINGYAVYRRFEDVPGGWNYRLVEHQLTAAPKAQAVAEPQLVKAERRFKRGETMVDAFQWLPHAVPPVALPEWFIRADFEHKAETGELTIRQGGQGLKVQPSDWIVRDAHKLVVVPSVKFSEGYQEAA